MKIIVKRIELHMHVHGIDGDAAAAITHSLEHIMQTQAELVESLTAINATVTKIGEETRSLLTKVDDLVAALANTDTVSPEVEAAVSALAAKAAEVDALVADLNPPIDPPPVEDPQPVVDPSVDHVFDQAS